MKKQTLAIGMILLAITCAKAQNKNVNQMEKKVINPWKWQDARSYVQAVEVKHVEGTLYVSGQTAIDNEGNSSTADMKTQLQQAIKNLEKVIYEAGYKCENIVRLNVYTTSSEELLNSFGIFQEWIEKNNIKQASSLIEVKGLYETLKVELEATVVK
ncbi:Endoribonuclease L-PSP [Fulvivirga imtechensis AK7]|uniref:Endoribonuclease L-PSP n=1 Tax=Fulvivirga imtechensis AK7 TaxID=1237149 RepID=L8JSX5_9BACT|nr:RidA family protein [Fulvivirga imtechensis]ELR71955.1 Endoribonuclease L-PSP [Fulvivirga imtechensis AK7]